MAEGLKAPRLCPGRRPEVERSTRTHMPLHQNKRNQDLLYAKAPLNPMSDLLAGQ